MSEDLMRENLKELFNESIAIFFDAESKNIAGGTSEQNLCCRLAMIMENKMKEKGIQGYYADTEYNRMTYDKVKKIWVENQQKKIYSDLIVHSRGEIPDEDNLIAIEMKKSTRPYLKRESDKHRLKSMTKHGTSLEYVCGYKIGFYIEIDIAKKSYNIEEFREGDSVGSCIRGEF